MLASAVRDYVALWGVSPGDRTVIVANNDDAYRTALALAEAGLDVPAVLDARPDAKGLLPEAVRARGIPVLAGRGIASVKGTRRVTGVTTCLQAGEGATQQEIACDAVAMSGGWSPVVHLWSHCGGKLTWDADRAQFAPDPDRSPLGHDGAGFVIAAGSGLRRPRHGHGPRRCPCRRTPRRRGNRPRRRRDRRPHRRGRAGGTDAPGLVDAPGGGDRSCARKPSSTTRTT
jgi:hypothetical protein